MQDGRINKALREGMGWDDMNKDKTGNGLEVSWLVVDGCGKNVKNIYCKNS